MVLRGRVLSILRVRVLSILRVRVLSICRVSIMPRLYEVGLGFLVFVGLALCHGYMR
jgi:hypothetical protein